MWIFQITTFRFENKNNNEQSRQKQKQNKKKQLNWTDRPPNNSAHFLGLVHRTKVTKPFQIMINAAASKNFDANSYAIFACKTGSNICLSATEKRRIAMRINMRKTKKKKRDKKHPNWKRRYMKNKIKCDSPTIRRKKETSKNCVIFRFENKEKRHLPVWFCCMFSFFFWRTTKHNKKE